MCPSPPFVFAPRLGLREGAALSNAWADLCAPRPGERAPGGCLEGVPSSPRPPEPAPPPPSPSPPSPHVRRLSRVCAEAHWTLRHDALQLSDKKWRGRPGEQDRAAGFANFLRCALECIPAEDRENLELKASLIEREAWGGVPCWRCHTEQTGLPARVSGASAGPPYAGISLDLPGA